MTQKRLVLILCLVALVTVVRPLAESASASTPAATIADFAWLQGLWTGTLGEAQLEQYFSPLTGGAILGVFRLVETGQPPLLEFAVLRETPQGIELRVRHFGPRLKPVEGEDPILLQLTGRDSGRFVFENPVNTQPKSSTLERQGDAVFQAHSEIISPNGARSSIVVDWHRQMLELPAGLEAPGAAPGPGDLARLGWFAGHWVSTFGQGEVHEFWLGPAAGVMAGALCPVGNGKAQGFEFSSLEAGKDTLLAYTWQFEPDLKIVPGRHTIEARRIGGEGATSEFKGTVGSNTFREKVEWKEPGQMHKRLEIFKPDGSTLRVIELSSTRVAGAATPSSQGGSR
ncbi:MAG TPA: DUF6265 family protein [Terriglobia bacterium]|nr:DUF6265 family protein [Terriglobia bacterium]